MKRRDAPRFCLIKAILGLAFRDMASASKWIPDPQSVYNVGIPDRVGQEVEESPVIRQGRSTPHSSTSAWNCWFGRSFGMKETLNVRCFVARRQLCQASLQSGNPWPY